jgi:hypothetical protein
LSGVRVEWRGDLFAADLGAAQERLRAFPVIPREFEHTVTIFLHPAEDTEWDVSKVIRLRAYAHLRAISAEAITAFLDDGVTGKLQAKALSGETRSLGLVTVKRRTRAASLGCDANGGQYIARSVRVSRRIHHTFAADRRAPFGSGAEAMRLTVDLDRWLFRLEEDGTVALLGQIGPRIEIKGPTSRVVERVRRAVDPGGLLKRTPNRSLELLFQDMLRRRVTAAAPGFPEMELKFDLRGEFSDAVLDTVLAALGDIRMLLPPPHRIERMRRYHVCHEPAGCDECTVVETTCGRLSEKRKRHPRSMGGVLLRNTASSRTTDRDGSVMSLECFLAERSWTRTAMFEKKQTKVPFALANGRAYQISFDRCMAPDGGEFNQIELELIGTVGDPSVDPVPIARDMETLGARLLAGPLARRLAPSACSKHAFFSALDKAPAAPEHFIALRSRRR